MISKAGFPWHKILCFVGLAMAISWAAHNLVTFGKKWKPLSEHVTWFSCFSLGQKWQFRCRFGSQPLSPDFELIQTPPICKKQLIKDLVSWLYFFSNLRISELYLAILLKIENQVNFEKNILLCKRLLKELQLKLMNSRATVQISMNGQVWQKYSKWSQKLYEFSLEF